jgi:hypothetical protein
MSEDRRRERQRLARQLMRALTGEGEPVIITEAGDVSEHRRDHLERISPSMSYRALVDLRHREYEAIRGERPASDATSEAWQAQNLREQDPDTGLEADEKPGPLGPAGCGSQASPHRLEMDSGP